jgi:hypothetical protein
MVQVDVTLSDSRINTIVGYSVCLKLYSCDSFLAVYTPDGRAPAYGDTIAYPSAISDNAYVAGVVTLNSSANCGTYFYSPPDSFLEWNDDNGFLASWTSNKDATPSSGDAWCVIDSDSSVSSPLQQQIDDNAGLHDCEVKIFKGSHSSGSRPVVGTCVGTGSCTPLRNQNQVWIDATFSGGGIATSKFTKSSLTIAGYTGSRPTITAASAGVVHITVDNVYYDFWWRVFRGATKVIEYGSDSTPDEGGNTGAIDNTFSVSVGDVITLGDPSDYNTLTNVAIWWTAS